MIQKESFGITARAHFRATVAGVMVQWSAPPVVGSQWLDDCWH